MPLGRVSHRQEAEGYFERFKGYWRVGHDSKKIYEQGGSAEGVPDRDKEVCVSFKLQESKGARLGDYSDEFHW